jgi:hypothetical protein
MTMLLIAGFAVLAVGLLAIALGIPVKEFSFGNTLILTGAVAACTGVIILGLAVVVRELQNIARRLGPANAPARADGESRRAAAVPPPLEAAQLPPGVGSVARQEDLTARPRDDVSPPPPEPAAPPKPRRNLLFSSSRKERERAGERPAPAASESPNAVPPNPALQPPAPGATFDDAWPQSERARSDALRRGRPSTSAEPAPAAAPAENPPPARAEEPPPVTVLKSGVVDGMAYSLYSDGSIEAQMPEGMMRFASIDELRSHLDHRP